MRNRSTANRGLSQQDAFFVAYQEASAVAMQLGVELEISGTLGREELERCLARLVEIWPQLGQTVHRRVLGLAWQGPVRLGEMLAVAAEDGSLERWRNTPIDPFREPPFQLMWIPDHLDKEGGILAIRAHHSALDGQALAVVCSQALRILAGGDGRAGALDEGRSRNGRPWRQSHLGSMWRYLRWLRRESRQGRSARLAVRATAPGDVGICSRWLTREHGIPSTWLCCAAWVRALGGWNAERGGENPLVSLEVPVSTRRGGEAPDLGNGISPLLLFGDSTQPLEEIACDLRRQFVTGVRQRSHLAVPVFTAAGRYLPWRLFRRLACNTVYSGFATSHFTWMRSPIDRDELARLSGGRLKLRDHRFYGPVCLHMGAALQALETDRGLQLSITHRLNALTAEDAGVLADRLLAELAGGIS